MALQVSREIEWRPHLPGILILLAATAYLAVAAYIQISQNSALKQAQKSTQQQQALNQEAAVSLEKFTEFYPVYVRYEKEGRIGLSNRLNWIETLDTIANTIEIPDIHFNLEKTKLVQDGETPFFHYEIPLYITDMYFDLKLLHEGDLYHLLNDYAGSVKGSYSVEACEIRKTDSSGVDALLEGLRAKCHLRWFNVHDLRDQWLEDNSDAT